MVLQDIGVREQDVKRWEGWLSESFPPTRFARVRSLPGIRSGEAVWQVEIRHGKLGWIHITREALGLNGDRFIRLTRYLSRIDWYPYLDQWIRIRIDCTGTIQSVD